MNGSYIGKRVEFTRKFKVYIPDGVDSLSTVTVNPGLTGTVTDTIVVGTLVTLRIDFKIGNQEAVAWLHLDDVKILD